MRILIAHHSPVGQARLQTRLSKNPHLDVCRAAAELTQVYDYAEHHRPDCVLMSGELANCAEFELLDSLFRIMGIGCVLIKSETDQPMAGLSARAARHVVWLELDATDEALVNALHSANTAAPQPTVNRNAPKNHDFDKSRLILIGSSTGGVDALLKILKQFPANCPPTLIVQHTGGGFAQSLIRLLDGATAANVQKAEDGARIAPGAIYLAPGDGAHLCLAKGSPYRISMQTHALVSGHRPSVDALFLSARHQAPHITAAILTGMGRDGAEGLAALRNAGARTFGQDEASSVVYGMPRVAMELGGVETQLPIDQMGQALLRASAQRVRA